MIQIDPSQRRVLALRRDRHARILGAPGSGKSTMLIEAYAAVLEQSDLSENDVLVLAPSRLSATGVRSGIEARTRRPLGGTPVRTPASLAYALLGQAAAIDGDPAPRLLTGTVQDEAIAAVIERRLGAPAPDAHASVSGAATAALAPEVLRSPAFRAELREFWRVIDDFDLDPAELLARLAGLSGVAAREALTDAPDEQLLGSWAAALQLIAEAAERLTAERPSESSASALLRAASRELRSGRARPPRLLLVDDAQELGEGQLALLAACAAAGSRVWAFGDPDTATATFHGERSRILTDLHGEFARRGSPGDAEQLVVLERVHRHCAELRAFVRGLTARVGASGVGGQRAAEAASEDAGAETLTFTRVGSPSEQIGVIAYRLRRRRLGLDGPEDAPVRSVASSSRGAAPLKWGAMAVICRSRAEAARVARGLAAHQVPTGIAAGGLVLREHRVVRDLIRLLQHALGLDPLDAAGVLTLLSGPLGGLDPVAVRRLRGALMLQERREAREEQREVRETEALVLHAFAHPGDHPAVDSRGGRALRRLGRIAAAGATDHAASGTPRETLWALWSTTGLSDEWQHEALNGRGARSEEAHRSLDAVMGLFFALQRHEEQASEQAIGQLLDELLENAVPEDSLAQRAQRDAVTVTTPQGAIGREFELVAVVGVQDGAWPNTRARGSLLGTIALERWLRGAEARDPSRRDTIHDELRLFAQACARARSELLVVAIGDEDHHPSPFFAFGRDHLRTGLPSSRLTLRGATSTMRRRLVADPGDAEALASLAALARAEAPGAHPEEWYGVMPASSSAPLHDLEASEQRVPVSPSQMERAETCPLDWVIGTLGGSASSVAMNLGTLVHHAFENAEGSDAEQLLDTVMQEWRKLEFDAEWEAERARGTAAAMAQGLAAYLREFASSDRELLGRETGFSIPLGRAELRGTADRLEGRRTEAGLEVSVLDLKTGARPPSGPETERHAQLQAYQLGVVMGAFAIAGGTESDGGSPHDDAPYDDAPGEDAAFGAPAVVGGARLLYVHPDATRGGGFVERAQQPLGDEAREVFVQRVSEIAEVMADRSFTARVEHHCSDPFSPGDCRIHIIPAVSHS